LGLFEPENENTLVKWEEKIFSKFYYGPEDCGTWAKPHRAAQWEKSYLFLTFSVIEKNIQIALFYQLL